MDVSASLSAPCSAEVLFAHVIDLGGYPNWTDLVHRATSEANTAPPTWDVELRARVGPLARSKRLRMQRTLLDAEHHAVRFERVELDGRRHSPWVLTAVVSESTSDGVLGASLTMKLHYGGALWTGGVLERVLADQITSGRDRLRQLVSATR